MEAFEAGYDMGRRVRELEHVLALVAIASVMTLGLACLALYLTI